MIQCVRIASAALAAALVMSCSSSDTGSTSAGSAYCAGDAVEFWCGAPGRAEIDAADLAYLATFEACGAFGAFGTAEQLAAYLAAGIAEGAAADHALCAEWFTFALNARNARFLCGEVDVQFALGEAHLTFADVEGAVNFALSQGGAEALAAFFAQANGGASVCVCEATGATGGTGGTGGTGSWGE
jgi:hypothetical protein